MAVEWNESDDKLGRVEKIDWLISYLTASYQNDKRREREDGFVLNINAEWGAGKTFFLKGMYSKLQEQGFPVVYYDAWSDDFTDVPLLGFIAELGNQLEDYVSGEEEFREKASSFVKGMALASMRVALGAGTRMLTGMSWEAIRSSYETGAQDSSDNKDERHLASVIGKEVDSQVAALFSSHKEMKHSIDLCRKQLEGLVELIGDQEAWPGMQLPVFVLVDELDRCRPDFAVRLLEGIKHLFAVKGVYFLLGTNTDQLHHTIQALYGNNFDSAHYLKRFISQTYHLPEPNRVDFIGGILDELDITSDLNRFLLPRTVHTEQYDKWLAIMLSEVFDYFNISPRDIEQCLLQLQASLFACKGKRVYPMYLLVLIVFRHKYEKNYIEAIDSDGLGVAAELDKVKNK